MSAPNAGRQSPDPENQTEAQQGAHPGAGKIDNSEGKNEGKGGQQKSGLADNPTHPLAEHAEKTTSKS